MSELINHLHQLPTDRYQPTTNFQCLVGKIKIIFQHQFGYVGGSQ
jgi:hypothetical protein